MSGRRYLPLNIGGGILDLVGKDAAMSSCSGCEARQGDADGRLHGDKGCCWDYSGKAECRLPGISNVLMPVDLN